jgi:hypothetical protein
MLLSTDFPDTPITKITTFHPKVAWVILQSHESLKKLRRKESCPHHNWWVAILPDFPVKLSELAYLHADF